MLGDGSTPPQPPWERTFKLMIEMLSWAVFLQVYIGGHLEVQEKAPCYSAVKEIKSTSDGTVIDISNFNSGAEIPYGTNKEVN